MCDCTNNTIFFEWETKKCFIYFFCNTDDHFYVLRCLIVDPNWFATASREVVHSRHTTNRKNKKTKQRYDEEKRRKGEQWMCVNSRVTTVWAGWLWWGFLLTPTSTPNRAVIGVCWKQKKNNVLYNIHVHTNVWRVLQLYFAPSTHRFLWLW